VGVGEFRGTSGVEVGTKGLMRTSQLILSMGLDLREVCILAPRATVLSQARDFSLIYYHTCVAFFICAVNILPVPFILLSSVVKNKPCDEDSKQALIPGPASLVANIFYLCYHLLTISFWLLVYRTM
jgi:hypothetical protein